MERLRRLINIFLSLALVVIGAAAMALLLKTKPVPPVHSTIGRVPRVALARIESVAQQAPIVGYGTVRPKYQVEIIPQVSGQLTFAHPDLAVGKVIPSSDLLYEIDPRVYEARVRQVEAEIRGSQASLARHDQEAANLDDRLANAEKILEIAEEDYLSTKSLFDQNAGTKVQMDYAQQKYLTQKDVVSELRNLRSLIPHIKLETEAHLEGTLARLIQAKHDLEATKIFCPFKARVEAVSARESQVVTAPFAITTLTSMEAFELSVGIDPRQLRWLDSAIQPAALDDSDYVGPDVRVVWSLSGQEFSWRGRVSRFERVDERTRTAQIILEIHEVDMIASAATGSDDSGPILSIGMHCKAELPAASLSNAIVIPRHAIYDDRWVYVYEPDEGAPDSETGRLARRRVPLLRGIGDDVLVDYAGRDDGRICELQPGDLLVVSPLIKPVIGMKIARRSEQVAFADPLRRLEPPQTGGDFLLASIRSVPQRLAIQETSSR